MEVLLSGVFGAVVLFAIFLIYVLIPIWVGLYFEKKFDWCAIIVTFGVMVLLVGFTVGAATSLWP